MKLSEFVKMAKEYPNYEVDFMITEERTTSCGKTLVHRKFTDVHIADISNDKIIISGHEANGDSIAYRRYVDCHKAHKSGQFCDGYQISEDNDEPIDRCKNCMWHDPSLRDEL